MANNNNLLPVGALLQGGKYRVEQQLASGGFGNTYRVVNVSGNQTLAMKEFYLKGVNERDEDSQEVSVSNAENAGEFLSQKKKFHKEAQRLQQLNNSHVVRVYDLFEEHGTAYYVMDFLMGESLSARLRKQGHPFAEEAVLDYTSQVLDALEAVHAENIWHLDLKPGNVMTDGNGRAVLIDFGASKQYHDGDGRSLSTSTGLCYTPGYAPTEQIESNTSRMGPWTDLYALGATMYNLLTMHTPPSVSDIQDDEGFDFPDTVSPECQRLVRWLMNPNRRRRPQSVQEVKQFMYNNFGMGASPATVAAAAEQPTAYGQTTVVGQTAYTPEEEYEEHSNSKLPWILGGVAAVAFCVVALFVAFVARTYLNSNNTAQTAVEQQPVAVALPANEPVAEPMPSTHESSQQDKPEQREQQQEQKQKQQEQKQERQDQKKQERQEQREVAKPVPTLPVRDVLDDESADVVSKERQEPPAESADNTVYDVAEQMPNFPGGDSQLMTYLSQNIRYPVLAAENGIQGRVVCSFIVERDGSLTDVKVSRSVDPSLDREALRVIKSMPRWMPGKNNGSTVRVKYTLPVTFRLQ